MRSPMRNALPIRKSTDEYRVVIPRFRPRFPVGKHPQVASNAAGSTSVPSAATFGRSVWLDWSLFVSTFERMLNGRPLEISTIGANVMSDMTRSNIVPLRHPVGDEITPLTTNRWRWSNSEFARSARRLRLSCGSNSVCKSDESSTACDHVYDPSIWKLWLKRFFTSTFSAL